VSRSTQAASVRKGSTINSTGRRFSCPCRCTQPSQVGRRRRAAARQRGSLGCLGCRSLMVRDEPEGRRCRFKAYLGWAWRNVGWRE
jgi:hypothetical protein